jgi:hypothetical protein
VLAELLQLLFDHIVLSSSTALISPRLLSQASNALFGTICCHQVRDRRHNHDTQWSVRAC